MRNLLKIAFSVVTIASLASCTAYADPYASAYGDPYYDNGYYYAPQGYYGGGGYWGNDGYYYRNNMNINSRLQYRFKPMSDLFLVYTDNYFTSPLFKSRNRALVFKLNYWLNL